MIDLWGILYPRICPICKRIISDRYICRECESSLPYIVQPRCFQCGKPVHKEEQEYCNDCKNKKHIYTKGTQPFLHVGKLKDVVYEIKYNNKREYIDFFVDAMVRCCKKEILSWKPDILIPVPMYRKKQLRRGFNQAGVIAKRLSKPFGIPVCTDCLIRISDTRPQKQLDDIQRKKNLENAFKIRKNIVKSKKVVIVDDIYTTGSTVDACAKVLLEAGAKEVYFVCMTIGTG